MRGYAICTSQRTGSTLLSQLLRSTGVLGMPREYFDAGARRKAGLEPHERSPEAQFASIQDAGATANGVYGVKLFPTHFDWAAQTRWAARLPDLHFVFLRRWDLLGQAVSQARAWQTRQWTSNHEPEGTPVYDAKLIEQRLLEIVRHNARWDYYFGRNGLRPLCLFYEDIVADPAGAVAAVAHLVGVDGAVIDDAAITLSVQRDQESEAWRARFVSETRDLTLLHA